MQSAYEKYNQLYVDDGQYYPLKVGELTMKLRFNDIYYFETSSNAHKVILREKNGFYEYYGNLKEIEECLDDRFFRCHRSFLINLQHIEQIDLKNREVKMPNGLTCEIAFKNRKLIKQRYLEYSPNK